MFRSKWWWRLVAGILIVLLATLGACQTAPTETAVSEPAEPTEPPAPTEVVEEPTEVDEPEPTATEACSADGMELNVVFPGRLGPSVPFAVEVMQDKYPGLVFNLSDASSTYTDTLQQIVADSAADLTPDVAMAGLAQISFFVDNLGAQPIDASLLPETYDERFLEAGMIDGKLYAVPTQISVPLIIWNKAIFEQAGLDPEDPPDTIDEMEAYAETIKAEVDGVTPTFLPTSIVYDWIFQNMLQSSGGQIADESGNPAFNSEAGVRALQPWYDLNQNGLGLGVAGLDGFGAFHEGVVGMAFSASSQIGSHTKAIGDAFPWGAAVMPIPEGGERRFAAGGNSWVLLTDDPCRAQFATEFIAATVTPEAQAGFSQVTGYVPVDEKAVELNKEFYENNPNFAVSVEYDGKLTPWVAFRGERAFEASEEFRTLLESVASGTSPQEALDMVEQNIQDILSE
jgi:multiple sugar transport system substrate-binding protein